MKVKMFDEVKLRDGRKGHIVEIYETEYWIDIKMDNGDYEIETIKPDDVIEIIG